LKHIKDYEVIIDHNVDRERVEKIQSRKFSFITPSLRKEQKQKKKIKTFKFNEEAISLS